MEVQRYQDLLGWTDADLIRRAEVTYDTLRKVKSGLPVRRFVAVKVWRAINRALQEQGYDPVSLEGLRIAISGR
ncbi:hypothetical protein KTAU_13900 [Thermogemmatispora aurantia]|uniref:HTH cro/C1-type domain-containing protein n=1 Tax=Thermogemmatispora aurantia TaxID=2045279 RepID=A0A5J4K5H5_9CHLR|nr:hypothetical protein KTAU_13900 [Thermogemmatispora aurantia]